MDQPRRTPSIKQRPRLPAPFPRDIRGGRVVGVVSELKAQVRRGCSGAQGWTPSPPIRPHFCPPLRPHLRPHLERSAAADSASTGPGPRPRQTGRLAGPVAREREVYGGKPASPDTSGPTCAGLANCGTGQPRARVTCLCARRGMSSSTQISGPRRSLRRTSARGGLLSGSRQVASCVEVAGLVAVAVSMLATISRRASISFLSARRPVRVARIQVRGLRFSKVFSSSI